MSDIRTMLKDTAAVAVVTIDALEKMNARLRDEIITLKDWIRELDEKCCSLEVDAAQREVPD